ncbi:ABC transporter permease [Mucilaginibacter sp. BJC16-A38]|uniref:ABC transporter permease n=1 Tax=Mucilaginibacter phenanthrenivorans TaxID=1234842 RepID=UPI002157D0C3|nr:ABC transporter permease [Mucilaginibacter phenanthrenivorans]MCR8556858.1 ABC transporter permease [Mucilaginibacter phenanthrenivorans]
MIKSYFKIAWRSMMKNKFFSIVNIFGLSVGLTCCMLIALYLHYETSYDSYQKNIANLYQVGTVNIKKGEKNDKSPFTAPPVAGALKQEFPEIAECTRLLNLFTDDVNLVQYAPANGDKKSFLEGHGFLADSSFFKMFTYNFIEGNASIALANPNSAVISEAMARKIFGNQTAINKMLHISSNMNGDNDYRITGVFRPVDNPTHIDANFFLSFAGGGMDKYLQKQGNDFARNNMFYTYILLKPGANAARLESKFSYFVKKYEAVDLNRMGRDKKQFLTPVRAIHLSKDFTSNVTAPASRTYLFVLTSIAIFTLLIACINFMNLSTARSSKRSSEVGVRKVLGAEKGSLIRQFLGESVLITFIAFLIAVVFTILLLPVFNQLAAKHIVLSFAADKTMLLYFLLMALLTGLIAGSYPAFYLSSFNPVKVLKGKLTNSLAVVSIRKGLVVFQFIISVVLIIASVVIARQMNYMRNADLGFAKDQQIVIPLRTNNSKAVYSALRNETKTNPRIISVGASAYYPGIANPSDGVFYKDGQSMNDARRTRMNYVDADFLQTLDIRAVSGRLFSAEFKSDTGLIVNETAIKELGFASPQKAVGQNIHYDVRGKQYNVQIVGVVKDFHYEDLHSPVTPYAFQLENDKSQYNYMIVHTKAGNMTPVLKMIENAWHKYDQSDPFEYNFLDEQFQKNYETDNRLAAIVGYFTVIAILISCLGLFGLAAFSAEQRTREIGVRKVLGASVSTIVSLLSVDFLKLIIISVIIASPIAWWAMNKWLQGFAYRQPIDWTIFAYTTIIAVMIGIFTIGSQALKAALMNPVKSLRSE